MKLTTARQMRELDSATINGIGIPGAVLMENAGRSTVQVILDRFQPMPGKRVCVLAGRGNNGGDGFVVARYLSKEGCRVTVYLLSTLDRIGGDAKINMDICRELHIPIVELTGPADLEKHRSDFHHSGLIIDALLGTGLNSDVRGLYGDVIRMMNELPAPVVSIDIPSGLDSDKGAPLGVCVQADVTVTYGLPKIGQVVYPGREYVGDLFVVDISIPKSVEEAQDLSFTLSEPSELTLPDPRNPSSHKGNFGHLLVVAGSPGKTGAAAMASEAAARTGAGLVTLAVPKSLNPILEVAVTEVMTEPLAETLDGVLAPEAWGALRELLDRKNALAIGPGLSTLDGPSELVRRLVTGSAIPMVIDADGLNILARDMSVLKEANTTPVLTPHPGEMARLMSMSTKEVQADRMGAALELARKYGVVAVLKGAATVIGLPDGRAFINPTGNPGMASGGMGDILTGIIGGLLAQGLEPHQAAVAGVYIHGLAADRCAQNTAPVGYLATDLLKHVPPILHELKTYQPSRPPLPLIAKIF